MSLYSTHVTLTTGSMKRVEVDAPDRRSACAVAISQFPRLTVASVTAWPVRGESRVTLDALSLRISPTPLCHSAFGTLC